MDKKNTEEQSQIEQDAASEPHTNRNMVLVVGGMFLIGLAVALLLFGEPLLSNLDRDQEAIDLPRIPSLSDSDDLRNAYGSPLVVGDDAYDFALPDLDGKVVSLSDFSGRPAIVNYWATWCAPCRIEMPELQQAYETYQDQGLVVLAVNQGEQEQQVRAFFEELDLTITPLLDSDTEVGEAYGAIGLPATYFIDETGKVTAVHRGILTGGQIEAYLAQTLP
jgi:peroxiredoxin